MDNKNLMPQAAQPVNRISSGQLPSELAELSEEALSQLGTDASNSASKSISASMYEASPRYGGNPNSQYCSYDGDDAE